jgi:hypothetical protein
MNAARAKRFRRQAIFFAATTLKPERTATASSENVRYDIFPPSVIDPTSMLRRRIARKT